MLKRFSAAKKNSPVKIGPKMAVFREYKNLNIKYSHLYPQKALPYWERRLLTHLRRNPFKRVGCSLFEEPNE